MNTPPEPDAVAGFHVRHKHHTPQRGLHIVPAANGGVFLWINRRRDWVDMELSRNEMGALRDWLSERLLA